MLTVLLRYKKGGQETVYSAMSVEFFPMQYEAKTSDGPVPGLLIKFADGCTTHIGGIPADSTAIAAPDPNDRVDCFVMNEHGSTVARYLV